MTRGTASHRLVPRWLRWATVAAAALAFTSACSLDLDASKAATSDDECPAGFRLCGSKCTDVATSLAHCGACDAACEGQCVDGACVTSCEAPLTACDGACVDLKSNPKHCGECANACAASAVCSAGACKSDCGAGLSACSGGCVDLKADERNCGKCGSSCAAGSSCLAGKCAVSCGGGLSACGGSCVNTQSTAAHCGGCGKACKAGQLCAEGACIDRCPAGFSVCDSSCRDLQHDAGACGNCTTRCPSGLLCDAGKCVGATNGYPATDPWGERWDGLPRGAAPFADADATCRALGGRLPTATELFRNNTVSGAGALSVPVDSSYHWALTPTFAPDAHVVVRLSDGNASSLQAPNKAAFRCVWPDVTPKGFSGDHCNGPASKECTSLGFGLALDSADRPALSQASAAWECAWAGAQLWNLQQLQQLAQDGQLALTTSYLQVADEVTWTSGLAGPVLARVCSATDSCEGPSWDYDDSSGNASLAEPTSAARFRCVGRTSPALGKLVAPADCPEAGVQCFTPSDPTGSRAAADAPLAADAQDRPSATFQDASRTCDLLGGDLPDLAEFTSLVRAGWAGGSNKPLWTTQPGLADSTVGYLTAKWTDAGLPTFIPDKNSVAVLAPGTGVTAPFRCVYRRYLPIKSDTNGSRSCGPTQFTKLEGAELTCVTPVEACTTAAPCEANPGGKTAVDGWGYAWDSVPRAAATQEDAARACAAVGARLPNATELWRVRVGQTLSPSIGDAASTAPLWTAVPGVSAGSFVTVTLATGAVSAATGASTLGYRCVWPPTSGRFGASACHGDPAKPCFAIAGLTMDDQDRATLPQASAAWECHSIGGQLPSQDQLLTAIQGGALNGSNAYLWLSNPAYFAPTGGTAGYGYFVARWAGTGDKAWAFTAGKGSYSEESSSRPFRCVSVDQL